DRARHGSGERDRGRTRVQQGRRLTQFPPQDVPDSIRIAGLRPGLLAASRRPASRTGRTGVAARPFAMLHLRLSCCAFSDNMSERRDERPRERRAVLHSGSAARTRAGLAIVATIGIATLAGTAAGSGMQDAPALPIVLAPVAFILLAAFWLAPRLRGETGGDHARIGDFRHAADPVFITDLDGQPLAANPAAGTPLAGTPAGAPLSADQAGDFLAPYVADAPACRYRLLRDVMRNGIG